MNSYCPHTPGGVCNTSRCPRPGDCPRYAQQRAAQYIEGQKKISKKAYKRLTRRKS